MVDPRPRAADFSQDLQQELSSAGRRRSVMAAQGTLVTLDRLGEGWEYPKNGWFFHGK